LKVLWLCVFLGLPVLLSAEGESSSRAFYSFGSSLTVGDSLARENLGYGFCVKWGTYIDPSQPSSFYYGFFSNFFYHSVGGVTITDLKCATFGWRGLLTPWLGVDAGLSPVIGARISGNIVEGNAYLGICPAVGLFFPISDAMDISVSCEPVINLFIIDGSPSVKNKSYSDIMLLFIFKAHTQVKQLPWQ